jgi:hypothetical protein
MGKRTEQEAEVLARPRVVTIAGLLLLLLPVVGAVTLLAALLATSAAQDNAARMVDELARQGYPGGQELVDRLVSTMWVQVGWGTVTRLGHAVGMGVLAYFVLRGSARARIAVYAVAALGLVATICLGAFTGVERDVRDRLDRLADQAGIKIVDQTDLLPGWYQPFTYTVLAVSIGMILAAVWLLTRPAANAYFRGQPAPAPPAAQTTPAPSTRPAQQTTAMTPAAEAPPASPPAPPSGTRPPGELWGLPRWAVAVLAAVVVLAVGFSVVRVIWRFRDAPGGSVSPPDTVPTVDAPPRMVIYFVHVGGSSHDVDVRYSESSGRQGIGTLTRGVPLFVQPERFTDSQGVTVSLNASAVPSREFPGGFVTPSVRCTITVDEVEVARDENTGFCFTSYSLDDFTGTPLPPPARPAPSQPPPPKENPDCQYLTASQVADVVADVSGRARRLPEVMEQFDGYCSYNFAERGQYVHIGWTAGRRLNPTRSEKVIRVEGLRAIWTSDGRYMSFELPKGTLLLQANLPVSERVARQIVVELLKIVRPKVS